MKHYTFTPDQWQKGTDHWLLRQIAETRAKLEKARAVVARHEAHVAKLEQQLAEKNKS